MKTLLTATGALVMAAAAGPLFAMGHSDPATFTCTAYLELPAEDQAVAADALQAAATEAEHGMMAEDGSALEGEDLVAAVAEKCGGEDMGEMTLLDASMAEDEM